MRTWKPTLNSIHGFLGRPAPPAPAQPSPVSTIQRTMLSALGDDRHWRFVDIARRIEAGEDMRALWFLHAELMVAIAAREGEEKARERIDQISHAFDGLLPRSFASRHSPLGDH